MSRHRPGRRRLRFAVGAYVKKTVGVLRAASWMCGENYCTNYRVAGRSHTSPDPGLNNLGFRCARDL